MDRSFKNNADFKMNQQNFKLSDFGIETKPRHVLDQCKNATKYGHQIVVGVQSQQMQMRAGRLSGSGNNGSSGLQAGCNLSQLPSSCATLTCNSQPRRSPNQLQSVPVDRFRASSPNNLAGSVLQPNVSSVPSPGYWNQYGGQESGVNMSQISGTA